MFRIGKEEIEAVAKVIEAGDFFKINESYQETMHAEKEMQERFGCDYALFMTSGHAALTSALIGLGIGPGDQVIVPAYTYIATAMAVVAAGAIPVIAEVDETLTLCPIDAEKKITKHTKAIIPVHIQGFPCKMDDIMSLAKKYGLYVIEDACQADGGSYHGKTLGTIGDVGALSFNYYKIVTCGEGGALLTDNRALFERALIYHDSSAIAYFGDQLSGMEAAVFCGNEYRSNDISAAILRMQLKKLDGILADLRKNKKKIAGALTGICNVLPSNDMEGDCGTTLALFFDTADQAQTIAAAEGVNGIVPINTGKHIYRHWTPIMNKIGAYNPLMDPFKMEANRFIIPDYREDMCPKTLGLLSKTVYIAINPDWTDDEVEGKVKNIKRALQK